jgi:hypothetical protein
MGALGRAALALSVELVITRWLLAPLGDKRCPLA